jgi:hypothetical protein
VYLHPAAGYTDVADKVDDIVGTANPTEIASRNSLVIDNFLMIYYFGE